MVPERDLRAATARIPRCGQLESETRQAGVAEPDEQLGETRGLFRELPHVGSEQDVDGLLEGRDRQHRW